MFLKETVSTHALVSLEAMRDWLRLEDDTHDSVLAQIINAVTGAIERYTTRKLKARSVTQVLGGTGTKHINLSEWPAVTITSVRHRQDDNTLDTLDHAGWRQNDAGLLYLPNDTFWRGFQNIEIAGEFGYKAGTHDLELDQLELAAKSWCMDYWQRYRNQIGLADTMGTGRASATFIERAMPVEVAGLLAPFVRPES